MERKKLGILIIGLMCLALISGTTVYGADIDISGTFTPTSTTSANINDTSPAYGNIAPGGNVSRAFQLSNDGTVTIDSTVNTSDIASDLTLVDIVDNDAVDEYSIPWKNTGAGYVDLSTSPVTLGDNIAPAGTHDFYVNILMNSVGISAEHGQQNMAVTVTYTAST